MPTLATVNAQWTNSIAVSDADSRRINAGGLVGDGTNLGVRGGIVRHSDTSLAVTVNGSDQITVQAGVVAIPSSTSLAGVYMAAFGAVTGPSSGTAITARNSTNPRIDLVVADISSGQARIRTVDGTASSSPVAPALPAGSIELGRLNVPNVGGGAVTVTNTFRTYAASLGATLYVETAAQLPGSGNQKGQRAVALDSGLTHSWDGASWILSGMQAYAPTIVSGATNGNGTLSGRWSNSPEKMVDFNLRWVVGTTSTISASPVFSLPTPAASAVSWVAMRAFLTDSGTANYEAAPVPSGTGGIQVYVKGTNGLLSAIGSSAPFAWASGDIVDVSGRYERA